MDLREVKEFLKDTFKYLIVIVGVLFIAIFVVSFQQVIGPSMEENFRDGDILIVNKLVYSLRDIKRGEVVTLKANEKVMIKRIIGLPGETIEYKDNTLYINNEEVADSWATSNTEDFKFSDVTEEKVIPEGYYLVLGDNRENSQDSRNYGLVSKKNIVGKVAIRLFPFNKIKLY